MRVILNALKDMMQRHEIQRITLYTGGSVENDLRGKALRVTALVTGFMKFFRLQFLNEFILLP